MFADLLRAHPTLRRQVRPVTFFVQRPREANASQGRSFSTRLVAGGDVTGAERSAASEWSCCIRSPSSSVGLALSGLASTTKGCSDASGWGGSAGSLPKDPNVPAQRAGIFCATASGSSCVPRSLNKERRDRKPPSAASMLPGQIREHRRNPCSKSALGLAVALTGLALARMLARSPGPYDTLELHRGSEIRHQPDLEA